ncbi:hypothetical protein BrE312_0260 [Brenneria sp. EniD312]|nr:hypothetical protein BrE312_0260 [Brenneria sp. EniD312]
MKKRVLRLILILCGAVPGGISLFALFPLIPHSFPPLVISYNHSVIVWPRRVPVNI